MTADHVLDSAEDRAWTPETASFTLEVKMENNGTVLFQNDSPQWFIAHGENWVGPLTAADIYNRIQIGELTWAHFVWKDGQPEWKRICDVPTFQIVVPGSPPAVVQAKIREAVATPIVKSAATARSAPPLEEKIWFLHYGDAPIGPYSHGDVSRFLQIGKIHGRVYAWKDGMATWDRLENLALFGAAVQEGKRLKGQTGFPAPEKKGEQRKAPRRPMVARILMAEEKGESVNVAICRDISVGGMQVLTDRIPGPVGTRIRLNVSPSAENEPDSFQAFVAHGSVVRVLEDGRGFSFRFEKLDEPARRSIEEYIRHSG